MGRSPTLWRGARGPWGPWLVLLVWLVLAGWVARPTPAQAQGTFGQLELTQLPLVRGVRRAIVIGIDTYDDPAFPDLAYAARDAQELASVLADPQHGGFASVELVVAGDLSARAIVQRLSRWRATLGPHDLGVVFFSGHGTRWIDERNRSRVFLAARDTMKSDPIDTGLSMEGLQEFLRTLPSPRRVLILDACFTGKGRIAADEAVEAKGRVSDEKLPFSERIAEHEAQLFSTTYGRPALESARLGHGVYTYHLMQALRDRFDDADINGDLVVTVSEAHDFARRHTMETTGAVQVPMALYRIVGQEALVLSGDAFSRRRVEMALVSSYDGPQQGLTLHVDGQARGEFPSTVLVDSGVRRVEFRSRSGRLLDRGRFRFVPGQVYSVSRIRDGLNGGRHLLSVGYAHTWLPGEAYRSENIPSAPGLRLGYSLRFPGKDPFVRRLGLAADLILGGFPKQDTLLEPPAEAPPTTLFELGVGPMIRLDIPWVVLSVQPRFAAVNLWRSDPAQPFLNWLFGAVGVQLAVGVRPKNRLSVQVQYAAMLFDAALQGGDEPQPELMQRLVVAAELGL